MAKVSNFTFTNTSDATFTVTPKALGLVSNYAVSADTANQSILNNRTAGIDSQEIVSFRTLNLKDVSNNLDIRNPAPVKTGIQYGVQVEETLVTTDSTDASFRIDEPIVVSINIRHPKSANVTSAVVATALTRALSALTKADGSWRFDDLMRSAERPITD